MFEKEFSFKHKSGFTFDVCLILEVMLLDYILRLNYLKIAVLLGLEHIDNNINNKKVESSFRCACSSTKLLNELQLVITAIWCKPTKVSGCKGRLIILFNQKP